MSRLSRRHRNQALLRGRFRALFFLLLAACACAIGHPAAALAASLGLLEGLLSIGVARRRGHRLAHSFAVVDWLLLGCVLALAGGADSWLLGAVSLLVAGQLGVSPQRDWLYLLAPTPLLLIVLAIADPSLGGNQAVSIAILLMLLAGGIVAAYRIGPERNRRTRPARVDAVTGFYTGERLRELAAVRMDVALAEDQPLGLVYLRLQHVEDDHGFLGTPSSVAQVRGVAQRLKSQLGDGDLAFRLRPDVFVLMLPRRSLSETRSFAAKVAREVGASLIAGRRQTLATGASSFPAVGSFDELLAVARDEARPTMMDAAPIPEAARLATAL